MQFIISAVIPILEYRHQRNKLKLDDVPKLPEWQRLRQQHGTADITVPNLVIRRPSVVQGPGGEYGMSPGMRKLSGGKDALESLDEH